MKKIEFPHFSADSWLKATWGVAALGTLLSILAFFRSLEYDEAWTLIHYVPRSFSEIFSDLATPNNHPLNTLFIKFFMAIFGEHAWVMRIPSLIFGLKTMLLGIHILRKNCHSPMAVFAGSAALALSGILVHYAATARGYAVQAFGVMLAAFAMTELMQNDRNRRAAVLLVVGALTALFAITSGALFVTALALAGVVAFQLPVKQFGEWFKAHRNLWICGAIFAITALAWFLPHYAALQEARKFGVPLGGAADYFVWAGSTLWNLRLVPWLLAALAAALTGVRAARRNAWFAVLFPVFALLLSLLTNPGPERVYTALVPVTIIWSTIALSQNATEVRFSRFAPAMLAVASLATALCVNCDIARHAGPDWRTVGVRTGKLPADVLPLFRPGDSFPVAFNCPDAAENMAKRLAGGKFRKLLAIAPPEGKLEAADERHVPVAFVPSASGRAAGNLDHAGLVWYDLRPLSEESQVQGKTLVLQISGKLQSQISNFFSHPAIADEKESWLECNLFLKQKPGSAVSRAWLLPAAKHSVADYLKAAAMFSQGVQFYELATPADNAEAPTLEGGI